MKKVISFLALAAPTGVVGVRITAMDKSGRSVEWNPYPNQASRLTIVGE